MARQHTSARDCLRVLTEKIWPSRNVEWTRRQSAGWD